MGVLHQAQGVAQGLGALAEGGLEMDGVAQGLALAAQLHPLPGPGGQLLEVGDLLGQPLQALGALAFALLPGRKAGLGLPHVPRLGGQVGANAQHFVQEAQVALLGQEGLVVVLAGEAHPDASGLAQIREAAGAAVDPGAAAAVGGHFPAQHHGLFLGEAAVREKGPPGLEGAVHHGLGHGPGRALAHHVAVAPGPHQQGQGVHQEGLAGPGLAGEDGEAGLEVQGEVFHQGQILDAERREHGFSLP